MAARKLIVASSLFLFAAASVGAQEQIECEGCGAEAGAGLANPASPNNPDSNGDTDPANQASAVGAFSKTNIVEPGVAQSSWSLTVSGNGSEFESSGGTCKPNDDDDDCIQERHASGGSSATRSTPR